jgi:protein-disulfide isomerase-like protein with CxxC motif
MHYLLDELCGQCFSVGSLLPCIYKLYDNLKYIPLQANSTKGMCTYAKKYEELMKNVSLHLLRTNRFSETC